MVLITESNWKTAVINVLANYISESFVDTYESYSAKYCDTGFHFISIGDEETMTINYIKKIVKPIGIWAKAKIDIYTIQGNINVSKAEITFRDYNSNGSGMGETSPINSIAGSITTPSTKTSANQSGTEEVTRNTPTYDISRINKILEEENFYALLDDKIRNYVIQEFNNLW